MEAIAGFGVPTSAAGARGCNPTLNPRSPLARAEDECLGRGVLCVLGRVWLVVGAGHAAEDLEDHAEVAVGREVGDFDSAERAAKGRRVSTFQLAQLSDAIALSSR